MDDSSTYSNHGPICPYCGYEEKEPWDADLYDKSLSEYECPECMRVSEMWVDVEWAWECKKMEDETEADNAE